MGEVDECLYDRGCYVLLVYYWDVFSSLLWSAFQRAVYIVEHAMDIQSGL